MRHPLGQVTWLMALAYAVVAYGVQYLPPLFGFESAPVPRSLVLQYMALVTVGILLYVSRDDEQWTAFKQPLHRALIDPRLKALRVAGLVAAPLIVAWWTYVQVRPGIGTATQFRSVHPAPPPRITFRGRPMAITGLENPLRHRGALEAHVQEGRRLYHQHCLPCHGALLDGKGPFAQAFNPAPSALDDPGTIGQLTESYVFWRIAKGGPGLPREGTPWNSAMPAWEEVLKEDDIWAVIVFLYEQSGVQPRTWAADDDRAGA